MTPEQIIAETIHDHFGPEWSQTMGQIIARRLRSAGIDLDHREHGLLADPIPLELVTSDSYGDEWHFGGRGRWEHSYRDESTGLSLVSGGCECDGDPNCLSLAAVRAGAAVFVRQETEWR